MDKTLSNRAIMFIIITITFFLFLIGIMIYILNSGTNYISEALKYIKEYDNTQTYDYIGISKKRCQMYSGCTVEVYLRGKITHKDESILFRDGEIVPMAKAVPE
jgi:cbb3-type cytochrome oxidase subunit 3